MAIFLVIFSFVLMFQTTEQKGDKVIPKNKTVVSTTKNINYDSYAKALARLKVVDSIKDKNKSWKKLLKAPLIFRENGVLFYIKGLSDKAQKRFLRKHHDICKNFLTGPPPESTVFVKEYLFSDPHLLETRIGILESCAALAQPMSRILIFKTIWQYLPAYKKSVKYLKSVLGELQNLNQKKLYATFQKYMFTYHPEVLPRTELRTLVKDLTCLQREKQINTLITRGIYELVPVYWGECKLPYLKAKYYYHQGKYALAAKFIKGSSEGDWLQKKLKNQLLTPGKIGLKHYQEYIKHKQVKYLIRAVKTWFLGEHYQKIIHHLKVNYSKHPYLRWSYAYSLMMVQKKKQAKELLQKMEEARNSSSRNQANYWLKKMEKNSFRVPDNLKRNAVQAFYFNQSLIYNYPAKKVKKSTLLPVIRTESSLKTKDYKWLYSVFSKNDKMKMAFSLYRSGLKKMAAPIIYNYLASNSRRRRYNKYKLWECWHLAEGRPLNCNRFYKNDIKPNLIKGEIQSIVALDLNWPHLAPDWGSFLPLPYYEVIKKEAKIAGIPFALLYAIMFSESYFEPYIISRASAIGLFQVIPPTGKEISDELKRPDFLVSELLEPPTAIKFGATYLAKLGRIFKRKWPLVIAAYNAGPHQVKRWIRHRETFALDSWIEEIPFGETRHYVKKVLGRWVLYSRQLGFPFPNYPQKLNPKSYK